ncbi:hypothetical protein [Mycobacterium malmoense]|uniref:hypothetical protein n=1 Tax=Mycobacterium malmoense TaxID=1780 RepID=UPI001FC95A2D|nr:hypothetical protein [Mycobacterium malmoense]
MADADRSLPFYRDQAGFHLDVDDTATPQFRVVQRAPDGSGGAAVSALWHKDPKGCWRGEFRPGPDPGRVDHASFADFRDPDGSAWILQERNHRSA